jgi:CelD/BcsL family acetyltransferase involved in cellulose biosynthesis
MRPGIKLDVVSKTSELLALEADWDRLVDSMEVPSPFLSSDWNRTWWDTFGRGKQARVAVLSEAGRVVGIAPFYRVRYGPVRPLVPFGWPDRLTEQMEPIIPEPGRNTLNHALREWLLKEHTMGLAAGLDRPTAVSFGEQALRDDVYFDWRPLPPTWDELLDGLHRSMRGNIRYYPRLLERSGHKLAFRVADDVAGVRAALPTLFALHTARANAPTGERHRDRLSEPIRREFLQRLAAVLPVQGAMKVGILAVDGVDVAAQLWFERNGAIFLHYSGYEPEWSKFSVAMVVTSEIIRTGIERGMRRVEFLRGSKQFKTRWNTEQRMQTDVYYVRHPWLLPMFHRLRSVRRTLRSRSYRRAVTQPVAEPLAE